MLNIDGIYVPGYVLGSGLRLKGCEALIYSLIESFSSKDSGMYCSETSLAQYLGYRRECVSRALQALINKGLVEKSTERHKPGNTCCYYVRKSHTDMCEKVTSPCAKKSHHNEDDDIMIFNNTGYVSRIKPQGEYCTGLGSAEKEFDGSSRL